MMKMSNRSGRKGSLDFLTREEMEILIYMTSDIWITPDVKRFKREISEKLEKMK